MELKDEILPAENCSQVQERGSKRKEQSLRRGGGTQWSVIDACFF